MGYIVLQVTASCAYADRTICVLHVTTTQRAPSLGYTLSNALNDRIEFMRDEIKRDPLQKNLSQLMCDLCGLEFTLHKNN